MFGEYFQIACVYFAVAVKVAVFVPGGTWLIITDPGIRENSKVNHIHTIAAGEIAGDVLLPTEHRVTSRLKRHVPIRYDRKVPTRVSKGTLGLHLGGVLANNTGRVRVLIANTVSYPGGLRIPEATGECAKGIASAQAADIAGIIPAGNRYGGIGVGDSARVIVSAQAADVVRLQLT